MAKNIWTWVQAALTAAGAFLGFYLGEADGFLYALVIFVVLDFITGVICGIIEKKLSSDTCFVGVFKKVLIFLLVGAANILDTEVIGSGSTLRTATIFFYLSNEGISILENVTSIGLPVPKKLKDVLEQLHNKSESDGDDK